MTFVAGLIYAADGAKADTKPLLSALPAAEAQDVRVVMVALQGCPFCLRFERQVGVHYDASPEAKFAPLIRVSIYADGLSRYSQIKYTPTFLVLKGNAEAGRISGYPGADAFWEELGDFLKPLGFVPQGS